MDTPSWVLDVTAQDPPNMTVKISAGGFYYYNQDIPKFVEFAGGDSPTITIPKNDAKWVIIVMDQNGIISLIESNVSSEPICPHSPRGKITLARIYIQYNTISITNDIIFSTKPLFASWYGHD